MSDHIWSKYCLAHFQDFADDMMTDLIDDYLDIEVTGRGLDYVKNQTEKEIDLLDEKIKDEHKKLKKELEFKVRNKKKENDKKESEIRKLLELQQSLIKGEKHFSEDIDMTNIISKPENESEIQHLIKQLDTETQRVNPNAIL